MTLGFPFFGWRVVCFLACIPSGGALLMKVYGLSSMQAAAAFGTLPGCALLVVVWWWARRTQPNELASALALGFLGGLLGTLAYDLIRVPFLLGGQRVFGPISVYGIWILDAPMSSRFTDVVGWVYHFSNGITFGIMYALWMRRRHWAMAVVWAVALETIAVVSPFAEIFHLTGDYSKLGIAYLGHLAYGLPLGWLVYRWEGTKVWLASVPDVVVWGMAALTVAAFAGPLVAPNRVARDGRAAHAQFHVEGMRLNPNWLRVDRGTSIRVTNSSDSSATVHDVRSGRSSTLEPGGAEMYTFDRTGIHQMYVETPYRSRSSFVIVEPVEDLPGP